MNHHTLVVTKIAELVRFDFVLLGFVVVHVALAGTESPRALYDTLFAEKIGGLNRIGFVGCPEDHSVAERSRRFMWFGV